MKILVIGDAILDYYVYGIVNRQSPEDISVSVLDFVADEYRLGGASNVAANIKSLSNKLKDEVYISTILSTFSGQILKNKNIFYDEIVLNSIEKPHKRELIKTRFCNSVDHKQLLRLDNRLNFHVNDIQRYKNKCFYYECKEFDAIVVSDYNKGIVDDFLINKILEFKGPKFIDTKRKNLSCWANQEQVYVKINSQEFEKSIGCLGIKNLIVTKGSEGADLYSSGSFKQSFPVGKVENRPDVIGAGDIFLSGFVVKFLESNDLYQAIEHGNKAAAKSVTKFGTVEVKRDEIG